VAARECVDDGGEVLLWADEVIWVYQVFPG